MAETKTDNKRIEREYIIPLRVKWKHVARYKRANRAVKAIKEFLVRHMKIRDGDLNKVLVDKFLNEFVWGRGIKNPPSKVKVRAIKEDGVVKAELSEMPEEMKFRKARFEKRDKKALEIVEKKKSAMEKLREAAQKKEESKAEGTPEETKEKEEKKAASIEASEKLEKEAAKMSKKETKQSSNLPKHQRRMALQK
ncbi:MAG: 50S ribosomal protein L31e [Nanoarchaeota archaeon]|nr:50S ribosomal protein L31e [Nanoarchaeota archaeon]